jgi:cyclic beta-1,2-glucan synthetase
VLDDRGGPLASQAEAAAPPARRPAGRPKSPARTPHAVTAPPTGDLAFDSGYGGFTPDGREYVVRADTVPPLPWSNVISNPTGGVIVTESGGGMVWAGNSQSNRLTAWSNDPVGDPPGDVVYLQDDDTGAVWSATPLPCGGPALVRHGCGYTRFFRSVGDLEHELTVFVPTDDAAKVSVLRVKNTGRRTRRLGIAYYAEWVLGTTREATAAHVVTSTDPDTGAVFARNPYHPDFGRRVAFADLSVRPRTITGDRAEFLGRNGTLAAPASFGRVGLSGTVGPGLDPCAALRGTVTLSAGEERTLVCVLGQGADEENARRVIRRHTSPQAALAAVTSQWNEVCEAVQVTTPDPAFDVLMNRWLPYQTLSCRVWGRSAFYQSGGAWGFRDQLQDVCSLLHARPAEARAHLLRAASRQFPEGDVQHWWHEPSGSGVRTDYSDDFLWLPFAACHYVEVTGDSAVLDELAPFLEFPLRKEGEHSVMGVPAVTERTATLFDHCRLALDHGDRVGAHGLPLMGGGDWNDGMNTVGAAGRGESVWLAWFQVFVLSRFAELAERRGEGEYARTCRERAARLREAVETHAWDGEWYRRAYFDDGTPLGSRGSDECGIDSIAQSWAVIAGGDPERASAAMDAVSHLLVRRTERLLLLFDPPFDDGPLRPGYIKGYLPGVRENGGQYTHAATWTVKALATLGHGDDAHAAFDLLNPIRTNPDVYKGEPYVLAGDVYSCSPHVGRCGWTWYTGSSGWLYRVGLEDLLGIRRRGDTLHFEPCVPASWDEFTVRYRFGRTVYVIEARNPERVHRGVVRVTLDGSVADADSVPLEDSGGERRVLLEMGLVVRDGKQSADQLRPLRQSSTAMGP